MAVYEAIPKRFAYVHPRYMTPAFGTIVMGLAALFFYLVLTLPQPRMRWPTRLLRWAWPWRSTTASPRMRASGISAARCSHRYETCSCRGIFPLLGGLAMALAFVHSAVDMIKPDYGYTAFGPIGGVFVLGVGMLVLGIPLMLACFAFGTKRFFRGETLTPANQVKVPDVY